MLSYMETLVHRKLRNNSAAVLRRVEAGESLEITNRGRAVARLVPAENTVLQELLANENARAVLASRSTLAQTRHSFLLKSWVPLLALRG